MVCRRNSSCRAPDRLNGGSEQAESPECTPACSLPPFSLSKALQDELRRQTVSMARALQVVGLMNVQFAIQNDVVFVLEEIGRAHV